MKLNCCIQCRRVICALTYQNYVLFLLDFKICFYLFYFCACARVVKADFKKKLNLLLCQ